MTRRLHKDSISEHKIKNDDTLVAVVVAVVAAVVVVVVVVTVVVAVDVDDVMFAV